MISLSPITNPSTGIKKSPNSPNFIRDSLPTPSDSQISSSNPPPHLLDHDSTSGMETRSKKSRKNQERRRGKKHDLDRLSNLPDSILTHIFSFLDIDSVVRTSVLSKRYKNLWTISPYLDFKLSESKNDEVLRYDDRFPSRFKKVPISDFELHVNRILQLREHCNLVRFSLSLYKGVRPEFLHNCLSYAVEHKVQHLILRGVFKSLALPRLLLESPQLIILSLHNATLNGLELPGSVSLPNLKALSLENFEFSNFNAQLFSGCPNLETLVLTKCSMKPVSELKVLNFNCLNLKHLEIKRWRSPPSCFDDHVIDLDAPKLAFLKLQGSPVRLNFKEVLPCVNTASFELFFPTACAMINLDERMKKISQCVLNMLLNVCSVKVLSLSLMTIEAVCSIRDLHAYAPVIFENLRIINLTIENKCYKKTMPIKTVKKLMDKIASDDLIFDGYKFKKASPESGHISIPAYFMRFLLASSPSAELLILEMPHLSSYKD